MLLVVLQNDCRVVHLHLPHYGLLRLDLDLRPNVRCHASRASTSIVAVLIECLRNMVISFQSANRSETAVTQVNRDNTKKAFNRVRLRTGGRSEMSDAEFSTTSRDVFYGFIACDYVLAVVRHYNCALLVIVFRTRRWRDGNPPARARTHSVGSVGQ